MFSSRLGLYAPHTCWGNGCCINNPSERTTQLTEHFDAVNDDRYVAPHESSATNDKEAMLPAAETESRPTSSNVRWIILLLMVAASFVSYVLRTNVSIVGATMISELRITEFQLGMVLSAFALGYALFQFPGGILGDTCGPRLAISLMFIAWGTLTVITALVPGPAVASTMVILSFLIVARFLVGATHAPIFPVQATAISNWFPVGSWGLPNGLGSTGLTLGAAATGPLIVWMLPILGWRGSFFVTAPVAFLLAALWWWYARDTPHQHASTSQAEISRIEANRPSVQAAPEKGLWKVALRDRNILLIALSYSFMNYVFYLFFNWFFYYLVEVRGFSAEEAAGLSAVQWILGAIGAWLGGLSCDRLIRRLGMRAGSRVIPIIGLIASGALLVAGAQATDPFMVVTLLGMSFGFNQLTEAGYWSAAIAIGGRYAGTAGGMMNTGANLVGFAGALIVPLVAGTFGWTVAIASGSLAAFAGSVLWLFVRADEQMRQDGA